MTARNDDALTTWLRAENRTALLLLRAERENSAENESIARYRPLLNRFVTDTSARLARSVATERIRTIGPASPLKTLRNRVLNRVFASADYFDHTRYATVR